MDFSPTEEQQMLRDLIERFAADTYPAADRPHYRVPATGFAPGAWSQLAELGLLAMAFPEELGGLGAGPVELMILGEALGKGVVPEPVLAEVLQAGLLLARAGTG
ncbi:MAG TPA: acyl-CoA dehydrogenase family protein, partial [Novosphingobium sp.]|nr:acyl-CoA dehydrogenase family protein [Novosphingobium sp.]